MELKFPCIIVNFKTYPQGTGDDAEKLAKKLENFEHLYIAVQAPDICRVHDNTKCRILAQHIDTEQEGAHTGSITAESVREAGAIGTLINHSEKRVSLNEIKETVELCRRYNLISVVCVPDSMTVKKVKKFRPDVIAVEPPELIGTGVSISEAKPDLIKRSVKNAGKIPLLCGAGIETGNDVKEAIELGAKGILVASAVVKSENPEKVVKAFLDSLK